MFEMIFNINAKIYLKIENLCELCLLLDNEDKMECVNHILEILNNIKWGENDFSKNCLI